MEGGWKRFIKVNILFGGMQTMNSNFKKMVSLFLVCMLVIQPAIIPSVAKAAETPDIPVLLYHKIVENPSNEWTDTSIEKFEKTMKYLNDAGYNTLTAEQYVSIMKGNEEAPENPILLTFDDATPDFITNALPILENYNMNAVLFVISDWIDGDAGMSEEQLKSLVDKEHVSLQNHTQSHDPDLWGMDGSRVSEITREQAEQEISESNTYLKSITGEDPALMAYPYGSYNEVTKEVNEANGISYAFKVGYPDDGEYAVGRHYVKIDTTIEEIADWIGGPQPEVDSDPEDEPNDSEVIYNETFENGLGIATQAGNAQLQPASDVVFEGNDNGKTVHVTNRSNNYDGIDIPFTDVGMENGKTYTITVNGYVNEEVTVPDDAQALLQNVDSYNGLYLSADYVAGQAFTLTGQYTVDTSVDSALRIQSNDPGSEVPFHIGNILITGEGTTEEEEEEEEPNPDRPEAKEFTTIDFEDQALSGFEGRNGEETLTITDEANHTENGAYALKVEDRGDTWHGPSLRVEEYVDQGQEYNISAWVKLISPDSAELQLSTQVGEGDGASYNNIQGTTVSKEDGWVKLEGTYRYSSIGGEHLTIYVESSNSSDTFYIDDVSFEPTDSGVVEIEKDLQPIKDVYKDDFLIGNAVSAGEFEGKRLELLNMHHNLVTAENAMKPSYAYDENGEINFDAEDDLVQKALNEGLNIHGHVLVWHQQSNERLHSDEDGNPLEREEALANLRNHIKTTVEHFGDDVISWDVVNEAMNDNPPNPSDWKASLRQSGWYHAVGTDFIEESFKAAKEVIDENGWDIKLYYNDYNDDNQNKAEAIYQMVKEINEDYAAENNGELLIDGIGMQAHYNLNTNPENVRSSMEKFISLGVEVGVTELDITGGSNNEQTEEEANAQAYLYAQLFQLYKEHADHISRVTFWGLNDATSWRAEQSPLLFDKDLQAKPAYYAVVDPDTFIENYDPIEQEVNQGEASYGTPVIDGDIDEVWSEAAELPVNRYQTAWSGSTGTAKALWDEENLYVLVEVNDSSFDKSNENPWEQDSIEVFVDENNGKTPSYEDDDGQYRVNFDNETSFNPEAIAEGFESSTHQSGSSYTVELKIPFKTVTPEKDHTIGFDVQINDAVDGARQSAATWNDTSGVGYQDTTVFGELTLLASDQPEPTPEEPKDPETPKDPERPNTTDPVITKPTVKDKQATVKDDIVEQVKENGELIIDLSDEDGTVSILFSKDQVQQLKKQNAVITINKQDVSIQIAASNFTNGNEAVEITLQKMKDIEDALSAVYDFKIIQGNQEISQFDANVTLSFKVDTSNVTNPDHVKVFYWNPETEEWELVGGNYQDGVVTVETDHFSTFTVFEIENSEDETGDEEQPSAEQSQNQLPDTATNSYNYLLAGLVVLLTGLLFFIYYRRKA